MGIGGYSESQLQALDKKMLCQRPPEHTWRPIDREQRALALLNYWRENAQSSQAQTWLSTGEPFDVQMMKQWGQDQRTCDMAFWWGYLAHENGAVAYQKQVIDGFKVDDEARRRALDDQRSAYEDGTKAITKKFQACFEAQLAHRESVSVSMTYVISDINRVYAPLIKWLDNDSDELAQAASPCLNEVTRAFRYKLKPNGIKHSVYNLSFFIYKSDD